MITKKQIQALKYLINKSKNASDLAKKVCFLLLDESDFLRKEVCISLTPENGFSQKDALEVSGGVHDMQSAHLPTHLNEIIVAMGAKANCHFSQLVGSYDKSGKFDAENGCTVWFAKKHYEKTARRLSHKKEDVEKVILQSHLYGTMKD